MNRKFLVNTSMAYNIKANENGPIIQINLDNDEDIEIQII